MIYLFIIFWVVVVFFWRGGVRVWGEGGGLGFRVWGVAGGGSS